jgi:hypothetical protein
MEKRLMAEGEAYERLSSLYQPIFEAANEGFAEYRDSPQVPIHRATTFANNVNDSVFAALVNKVGLKPVFDKPKSMRFLRVEGRPPILLWLKKTDLLRKSRSFLTRHAIDMDSGNYELFPSSVVLTLGIHTSQDQMSIARISFTPPCVAKKKPDWWIDILAPINRRTLMAIGAKGPVVQVIRSSQQRELGT